MKLSWMKLDVAILDNDKIRLIRKYPQGDSLFVLWIAILTKAMTSRAPGVLLISEGSPYSPDDLATVSGLDIKVVKMGIEIFARFGMISVDEYNTITVNGMAEFQAFDAIDRKRELTRKRVTQHRERQKNAQIEGITDDVTRYSVTSNATDKIRLDKIREEKIAEERNGVTDVTRDSGQAGGHQYFIKLSNAYEKRWSKFIQPSLYETGEAIMKRVDPSDDELAQIIESTPNVQWIFDRLNALEKKRASSPAMRDKKIADLKAKRKSIETERLAHPEWSDAEKEKSCRAEIAVREEIRNLTKAVK